jgi:tRNA(Ile)-lysidine synthase
MKREESSAPTSPAGFVEASSRYIEDRRLFDGVGRLLVGCSAGADSTVLLDVLQVLAPRLDLELAVCHLNHGLRGSAADRDEEHARALAEAANLPFFGERVQLAGQKGSLEDTARRARLDLFARISTQWPADAVALGHSADDQAETVMMNLSRGAGLRGLGGMRPQSTVGELLILLPLLFARREAIRTYATDRGLTWREDATNVDLAMTRNRVRWRLVPELESVHPGAIENIARAAALAQDEEDWLAEVLETKYEELRRADLFPGAVALAIDELNETPRGLRRRLLRRALETVRGHRRGMSAAHVDAVLEVALGPNGDAVDLPGVRVQRSYETLRLLPLAGRKLAKKGVAKADSEVVKN